MFNKKPGKKKTRYQRDSYAIKACYDLGFSVTKTSKALNMDAKEVSMMYETIRRGMIDYESGKF